MAGGLNGPPILNGSAYIYPTITLTALRDQLLCMLGFPDPLTGPDATTRTLAQLRASVLTLLGFSTPLLSPDAATRTLVQLRESVIRRTGNYYVAGANAPGHDELVNSFVNEAHQTVFRLLEMDKGGVTLPTQMTADSDPTIIDYVPVLDMAIGLAKAHSGQDDAKAYFDQVGKYISDRAARRPPNISAMVDAWINEAHHAIFRMVELDKGGVTLPVDLVSDSDPTIIDFHPVLAHAVGAGKAHYKQPDAKLYFDQVAKYISDRATRRPPKVVAMCTQWLTMAQKQLYHRYKMLRTELWWSIPISAGQRIYDVPSISSGPLTDVSFADSGPDTIDRVAGSWITDGFRVGYKVKAYGAANAGNNNVQWTITALTALQMTLTVTTDAVVAESAGASITINTMNYIELDFRTATEAWLLDNLTWLPLFPGINPASFTISTQTMPTNFELREYFEIFPEPQKAYTAWIKGHRGLMPFSADTDVSTIDYELILLQALVWGKQFFRQQDAREIKSDLEIWIGKLNAGTFAGLRFVPRETLAEPMAMPYPQVTFTRV